MYKIKMKTLAYIATYTYLHICVYAFLYLSLLITGAYRGIRFPPFEQSKEIPWLLSYPLNRRRQAPNAVIPGI